MASSIVFAIAAIGMASGIGAAVAVLAVTVGVALFSAGLALLNGNFELCENILSSIFMPAISAFFAGVLAFFGIPAYLGLPIGVTSNALYFSELDKFGICKADNYED